MKVKIIIKEEKEVPYFDKNGKRQSFMKRNVFVSHENETVYHAMKAKLIELGAEKEKAEKFSKPHEKDGKITYGFNLETSPYTFDRIERFGTLDAKIVLSVNKGGYGEAKIEVIDRKEQIFGYEPPRASVDDELANVDGWATSSPDPLAAVVSPNVPTPQTLTDLAPEFMLKEPVTDLPF
jgi:hypothetical protein